MFDELFTEAYKKLKNEICSMAAKLLIDDNDPHDPYYIGKMSALNEVIDIMNKVDDELYSALLLEAEREDAYYQAERPADESHYKQL